MRTTGLAIGILLALACASTTRAADPEDVLDLTDAGFMEIDEMVAGAKGRPNEEARWRGLKSYTQGRYAEAIEAFERGALYADKFSQHYLSLMHWHGVGVSRDPIEAYVWADLAAERMSRKLLLVRERMWQELTPAQRDQVAERGPAFYARYGDDVAKPRAEGVMRQYARDMTGSRVGYRNQQLAVFGKPDNGAFAVQTGSNAAALVMPEAASPDELYGKEGGLRRLTNYWQQQDVLLEGGKVEVGPLSPARGQRDRSSGPHG